MSGLKSHIIYDEELEQINFLDERFYLADNKKDIYYPSVTTVLDCFPKGAQFTQWLKDVGNEAKIIAERAAESGSKVHDGIEIIISGAEKYWDEKQYNEAEWNGLLKFKDFYENFVEEIYACELNIFSHKYKYAGTIDLVCKLKDGKIWLIDHKFGNAVYDNYFLQVAAYRSAFNELNSNIKIEAHGILHLKAATRGRDKSEKNIQGKGWKLVVPPKTYEQDWKIFKSTLDIYYYLNPEPKPKNKVYPAKIKLDNKLNLKLKT